MLRLFLTITSITFAMILQLPGGVQSARADDMQWSSSTFNDPSNRGRYTAMLRLGVPETDDVQVDATCVAGSSGTFANLVIGYNTGSRQEGAEVILNVSDGSRQVALPGTVYGTQAEFGVSGIAAHPDLSSPFWQMLASTAAVSYMISNGPTVNLSPRNRAAAVSTFLADCRRILAASNPAAPLPAPAPQGGGSAKLGKSVSCDQFGKIKSIRSKTPVTLTFVNKTGAHRGILWINFQGHPVDYAALNPGQSWRVKTFVTHPWMLTDGPGNCLEMYLPEPGVTQFNITAPNQYFGPE